MGSNLIIRPIGPLVAALNSFRQSLYRPPQTTIGSISEDLWPNPLQPVTPMGPPRAEPLAWEFNFGRNLIFTPREDAEYSSADLRTLAKYPLARICIENNKDMLTRMPWRVQLKPVPGETNKQRAARAKNDPKLKKLNQFLERPNPSDDWSSFIRQVVEDMLVIDAASIFIGRNRGGSVTELRWVDGSSINRLVDEHGWTPKPPSPAYQQLWQGYPRVDLTSDQLIYRPRNIVPRGTQASYLYGFSPTEQIAEEIKIGQARLTFVLDFYKEGTIPGGMLFAPIGTPPDKIKEAQQWLDSDLAGKLAKRRRLQILQGFQEKDGKNEQIVFPKEPALSDVFDEVHIRKVCFAYGTSPQRLMRQMNRASATVVQDAAEQEGTMPFLMWLKKTIDYIVQVVLSEPEYEFAFDPFQETDKLKESMADAEDIKIGLYTRNEIRERRGDDPREEPEADELNVITGTGVVGLDFVPEKPTTSGEGGGVSGARSRPAKSASTRSPKQPAQKLDASTLNEYLRDRSLFLAKLSRDERAAYLLQEADITQAIEDAAIEEEEGVV